MFEDSFLYFRQGGWNDPRIAFINVQMMVFVEVWMVMVMLLDNRESTSQHQEQR